MNTFVALPALFYRLIAPMRNVNMAFLHATEQVLLCDKLLMHEGDLSQFSAFVATTLNKIGTKSRRGSHSTLSL
jgi:hypothetical protein